MSTERWSIRKLSNGQVEIVGPCTDEGSALPGLEER